MMRLGCVVLAMLALSGLATSTSLKQLSPKFKQPHTVVDKLFLEKQMDILDLFYHIHEPVQDAERKTISESWSLEKNIDCYKNVTAVKIYSELMKKKWILPRELPFSVLNSVHLFEAKTLFYVFYSAKDYETFYKTAVYMRDRVNENLFVYVLSIAILNYPETQGIVIPPLYEVFPSYFFNGQIMTTAQRLNTHGKRMIDYYPNTYVWEDNIVIKWNETVWPYNFKDYSLSYFTNDYHINAVYYNYQLTAPFWLSANEGPLAKLNRGEYFWFIHKQLLTHYYMERLSNGLGEIPELNFETIKQGYESGLLYHNGIPFPTRPNYLNLDQPMYTDFINKIKEVESRLRSAIDAGYILDNDGKLVNIRGPESLNVLGKLIEGNADSPNVQFYDNLVNLWKMLLGNTLKPWTKFVNGQTPLVVPSALELYQTTCRDPAFYMIWKRVMKFFDKWSSYLPHYKTEELAWPTVKIEQVEVDKLVTYFENAFINVTNHLYTSEKEAKENIDETKVVVQQAVLNHKPFNIRVHVKSEAAKTVVVKFFLAPKYNGKGVEIPLHENTANFYLMDQFVQELPAGESIIVRESNQNLYMIDKWSSAASVYQHALNAYNGKAEFVLDDSEYFVGYPRRLMIPKGRVGGMPFVFMVYISEFKAPADPYGTGANPEKNYGIGTGARRITKYPLNFPVDRPLWQYQVENLDNMYFEDVEIYHKPTPEMYSPYH